MSPNYVNEKLSSVIHHMIVGSGNVRQRLTECSSELVRLNEKDFPEILKNEWRIFMHDITKSGAHSVGNDKSYRGSIENTLRKMHNRTASKIAERLYKIYLTNQEFLIKE